MEHASPRDDGHRARILAVGDSLGWPRLDIGRGEAIPRGEPAWRTFCSRAAEEQIERAVEALRTASGR